MSNTSFSSSISNNDWPSSSDSNSVHSSDEELLDSSSEEELDASSESEDEVIELYKDMGKVFKSLKNWSYYIITTLEDADKIMDIPFQKKRNMRAILSKN